VIIDIEYRGSFQVDPGSVTTFKWDRYGGEIRSTRKKRLERLQRDGERNPEI